MDVAEARAILVVMEVIGKMMVGLVDTGAMSRPAVKDMMLKAAEHLEPVSDDPFLAMMAEQWRGSAELFSAAPTAN